MDLRTLGTFIRKRLWLIVVLALLVEASIAGATSLLAEQYQVRSLVRLGKVDGSDVGAQGAVVEQVQIELEGRTQVSLLPRPNGMVLVTAEAATPAEAVGLAQEVTTLLVERSGAAIDLTLRERRATVEAMKASIDDVESQIDVVTRREADRSGSTNSYAEYVTATQLRELFDLRTSLRRQLQQAEIDLIKNVTHPAVLWKVNAPAEPFRPRWARNLIVGGIFGVIFGTAVVVLLGVLHQFPPVRRENVVR